MLIVCALACAGCGEHSAPEIKPKAETKGGAPIITIESADASATRANLDLAGTRIAAAENFYKRHIEMVEKGVGLESEYGL